VQPLPEREPGDPEAEIASPEEPDTVGYHAAALFRIARRGVRQFFVEERDTAPPALERRP
jgi:hypothetical protein